MNVGDCFAQNRLAMTHALSLHRAYQQAASDEAFQENGYHDNGNDHDQDQHRHVLPLWATGWLFPPDLLRYPYKQGAFQL